jgi:DNA-binding NarL/FixJ family response regulator
MTDRQLLQLIKLARGEDAGTAREPGASKPERLPVAIDGAAVETTRDGAGPEGSGVSRAVQVLLLTDEPMQAAGLSVVLTPHGIGLSTCGLAEWAAEYRARQPDVVLVDLVPDLPFRRIVQFRRRYPSSRVVLWSRSVSADVAVQAMEAGVAGVLGKTQPSTVVVQCLRWVAEGELWYDRDAAAKFLALRGFPLTERERELLTLVSNGMSNATIAATLGISESSVRTCIFRLMEKVGARNRIELVLYGLGRSPASGPPTSATSGRVAKKR